VRLWHVSSTECLHVFPHADFVTSVDFHPKNDLLFLSGCFDKRLRVWSIPESHVAAWATTPEMITSVCFSPSGNQALAGLFNGQVFFWHTDSQGLDAAPEVDSPNTAKSAQDAKGEGMKGGGTAVAAVAARLMAESHVRLRYYTQVEARNRRGKFQQGRKVTGLCWLPAQALRTKEQRGKFAAPSSEASEHDTQKMPAKVIASTKSISGQLLPQQLLVTTNDSRVRLFQMETFSQICKFKGLVNENMQIKSSFSWDGKYVVSGSENGHVHIWNTTNDYEVALEMSGEHLQAVKNVVYETVCV
jgi:WD repeat-containing protein 44